MAFKNTYEQRDEIKTLIEESPMDETKYVADKVLPPVMTTQISGDIPLNSASAGAKLLDLSRADRGAFKRTETMKGSDTYITREKGIEIPVFDIEALEYSDIFDAEVDAARESLQLLKLSTEKSVADALYNTTTFASGNDTQAVTTNWLDPAAKMYDDIDAAAKKIKAKRGISKGMLSLTLSEDVFNAVIRSTEVRSDVKYTSDINSESVQAQVKYLSAYLHIKEIILTTAVSDSTPEGYDVPSFSELWNPDFAMLGLLSPQGNSWRGKGLGRQPIWSKFAKDYKVESYDSNELAAKILRARSYRGEKIFKEYGCLLTGVSS